MYITYIQYLSSYRVPASHVETRHSLNSAALRPDLLHCAHVRQAVTLTPGTSRVQTFLLHLAVCAMLLCCASTATPQTAVDTQPRPGIISGVITDDTGTAIAGGVVTWSHTGTSRAVTVVTAADGRFSFSDVPSGDYRIGVSSPGFSGETVSGVLRDGEQLEIPPIRLRLAFNAISVDVTPPTVEVAERQIKAEEQQRLLGVMPNYFVAYGRNPAPLTARQKFELTRAALFDPVGFAFTGIVASVQHARNDYRAFGRGTPGYAKRYAALYASGFTRNAIDGVLLPALLKQDPRYFYKGTGTPASRIGYAVATAFVRKGDNGHWQPNYSSILGSIAAGALTNYYYPAEDRRGVRTTLQNSGIAIATSAATHLAQEFLFHRITTHAGSGADAKP